MQAKNRGLPSSQVGDCCKSPRVPSIFSYGALHMTYYQFDTLEDAEDAQVEIFHKYIALKQPSPEYLRMTKKWAEPRQDIHGKWIIPGCECAPTPQFEVAEAPPYSLRSKDERIR